MEEETPTIDVDAIKEDQHQEDAIEEMSMLPLKHFFDIEPFDSSDDEKLEFLKSWAQEKGYDTRGKMFKAISDLEGKIGRDPVGERRVSQLYRYIKLNAQIENLSMERDAYHKKS